MRFDTSTGALTTIGPVANGLRPTWTLAHPTLPILYAVDDDSTREGTVTAFSVDRSSGALKKINQVGTGGKGATHLWFDAPSGTLFVANFASAVTSSIAVNQDGSLGTLVSAIQATGSGPHRRQASAHAHSTAIDPTGRFAIAPDLGADRVFVYAFDRATHQLTVDPARAFAAPPGSGPRHLVFGKDGRLAYLIDELTAEVMTLRWDASQGTLALAQTLPLNAPDFTGTKSAAEIALARDGRFVYVANRSDNTINVYCVDAAGTLSLVQRAPAGGDVPWSFAIHPSGNWLLVANQRSAGVTVLKIDVGSGKLTATGVAVATPAPVNISFIEQ
jgi:6-phosphogluconolactonase